MARHILIFLPNGLIIGQEGANGGISKYQIIGLISLSFLLFLAYFPIFAKFGPNFSFSWAELVFNLDFPHPPNHPPRESMDIVDRAKLIKAKLISLLSRPHIVNMMNLVINFITEIGFHHSNEFHLLDRHLLP